MHRTAQILARGDPGFFDFIKKVGKVGLDIGRTAFSATPVGAVFNRFIPRIPSGRPTVQSRPVPQRRLSPAGTMILGSALQLGTQAASQALEARGAGAIQPAGTHLNKSSYFLRDGTFVPARSRYVRNRTRNNANGRALRRAIGRAKGFDNLVKRNRKALRSLSRI